jgi:hypothetical protein
VEPPALPEPLLLPLWFPSEGECVGEEEEEEGGGGGGGDAPELQVAAEAGAE